MRQKHYSDGSPSREVEDDEEDWETSGLQELEKFFNSGVNYKDIAKITHLRDELSNLEHLISNCVSVIAKEETRTSKSIDSACMVLLAFALPKLESIGEELKCLTK